MMNIEIENMDGLIDSCLKQLTEDLIRESEDIIDKIINENKGFHSFDDIRELCNAINNIITVSIANHLIIDTKYLIGACVEITKAKNVISDSIEKHIAIIKDIISKRREESKEKDNYDKLSREELIKLLRERK